MIAHETKEVEVFKNSVMTMLHDDTMACFKRKQFLIKCAC